MGLASARGAAMHGSRHPQALADSATVAPDPRAALLVPGRTCWRVEAADRAAVLVDGAAYFAAFAEAVERAAHSIILIGWDFNSRVRLRRRGVGERDGVGAVLERAVKRRPALRVFILDWDFSVLYAWQRELLTGWRLGRRTGGRLRFRLDDRHPVGGAQHQKLVVIDDALAFVGGLDFGPGRWDTPAHRAGDPRRVDATLGAYPPFHDVQMAVDGAAAAALGRLARWRWRRVTGERIPAAPRGLDPWPARLAIDFRDVEIGIARTQPPFRGRREVREVEALYVDAIAAARRWLYIENQYLTSTTIGDALCARLREADGPEIVIVQPRRCEGWLEQTTMGTLRARLAERLRAADRHGRLRLYYPQVPGLDDGQRLTVHAKVLVVDDRLLRVGSANLNNRSMGLDSECDLAIDAAGERRHEQGIAAVRNRLLAEHLGQPTARVAAALRDSGSLIGAIARLNRGPRGLRALEPDGTPNWLAPIVTDGALVDPDHRLEAEETLAQWLPDSYEPRRRGRHRVWPLVAAAVLAGVALYAAHRRPAAQR